MRTSNLSHSCEVDDGLATYDHMSAIGDITHTARRNFGCWAEFKCVYIFIVRARILIINQNPSASVVGVSRSSAGVESSVAAGERMSPIRLPP